MFKYLKCLEKVPKAKDLKKNLPTVPLEKSGKSGSKILICYQKKIVNVSSRGVVFKSASQMDQRFLREFEGCLRDALVDYEEEGGTGVRSAWDNRDGHTYVFLHTKAVDQDVFQSKNVKQIKLELEADLNGVILRSGNDFSGTLVKKENVEGGVELLLGGTDRVFIQDSSRFFYVSKNFFISGVTPVTRFDHPFDGVLTQFTGFNRKTGKGFRGGVGHGRFEGKVPLIGAIPDLMNSVLGGEYWYNSTLVYDFLKYPLDIFLKAHGEIGYQRLLSLRYEFERMNAWEQRMDSFLGMGDDVFLGNLYGNYGTKHKWLVEMGPLSKMLKKKSY